MTTVEFNRSALTAFVGAASKKAMYRAAGFLMTSARRKIRYRSYRMASSPGMPPYKHQRGSNSFSHSIRFAVDPAGTTAVIGPQRQTKPTNVSGPVPHTLEHGGTTRPSRNALWFRKKAPLMTTESAVASYFRRQRFAPLYMGTSAAAVKNAASSSKSPSAKKAPLFARTASGQYRLIYYVNVEMRSDRQARRAAKNVIKYFGYPTIGAGRIAARPYMGPTLAENRGLVLKCWENIVK